METLKIVSSMVFVRKSNITQKKCSVKALISSIFPLYSKKAREMACGSFGGEKKKIMGPRLRSMGKHGGTLTDYGKTLSFSQTPNFPLIKRKSLKLHSSLRVTGRLSDLIARNMNFTPKHCRYRNKA